MAKAKMSNAKIGIALINFTGVFGGKRVGKGLQDEKITIGTKNRIQKIVKKLLEHYEPYQASFVELLKANGAVESEGMVSLPKGVEPSEEFRKQKLELDEQICELDFDAIDFTMIENIETEQVYDFELLSPFFENYN